MDVPRTTTRVEGAPGRESLAGQVRGGLLTRVPTQRGSVDGDGPRRGGRLRGPRARVLVAAVLTLTLVGSGAAVAHARAEAGSLAAARVRVAAATSASGADAADSAVRTAVSSTGAATSARAAVQGGAGAANAQTAAILAAAPHAGDVPRAQLQAASDVLTAQLKAPATSLRALTGSLSQFSSAAAQVRRSESDWQGAEAARVAAAQAAADAAAQQATAAARAATRAASGSSKAGRVVRSTTPVPDPAGPAAVSAIPAGGKQCTSAGSGAGASSASAIGAAINAYRTSNGLPALSVSQSGTLTNHAVTMADAGGIWHSGADNIVGCVSNGSATSLVIAWSRSAPHNAQMLRTGVSRMSVGGASLGGWLYGAVAFG